MEEIGDLVEIITDSHTEKGIIMPSSREDVVMIKLENGYNMGFMKEKVSKITVLESKKTKKSPTKKILFDKDLPTISILHTGGTIASRVDYSSGGVVASFTADDFVKMFPEIKKISNIRTHLVANMMSEDMRFSHYKQIAQAIEQEIKAGSQGIIIGHGTDTLGITAAALSFMFENLPIPVIIVGSQRSTDRGSSDAGMNLICAAEFMVSTDFSGVAICMHEEMNDSNCVILPPNKTRKLHTSRRDAFKAVNDTAIAKINYTTKKVEFLKEYQKRRNDSDYILKDKLEGKVGIIRTHPNMFKEVFEVFRKHQYKGLIIEGSGIGQAPTNITEHVPIYEEITRFIEEGGVVILTSQCIFGRVHKEIYTNCRRLAEIGVIFGEDMLTETAFVKLAWLLGNYSIEDTKKLAAQNLRGEINDRIDPEEKFIC